ncbi:MAG: aldo/keto reductase [Clostridia bacterium]|nr:aldo/keto reductase [Clostridia bacterium]
MEYKAFKDVKLSRLGLGNMRLPSDKDAEGKVHINHEKAWELIDLAYEKGITYFDTAYVYNAGDSEVTVGEAMSKHDRNTFYIATKFNVNANPDYEAVFKQELERLQTDHIDFYLIHCLMDSNIDKYIESGAIEYFKKMKEEGKITYLGFSSHASVETLKRFADYTDWDFAQLQINYFDWMYGTSKAEYEILTERNIPVMVMEPVRGGKLSSLTPETDAILKERHPEWSISSWALRFVKTLPNVQVILSGMSTLSQVNDNIETFSNDESLCDEDMKLLMEVCEKFKKQIQVPCTGCRYCTDDCPAEINIPEFLNLYNQYKVDGASVLKKAEKIETTGTPKDCVGCGACTANCPQNIDTPKIMEELKGLLDK